SECWERLLYFSNHANAQEKSGPLRLEVARVARRTSLANAGGSTLFLAVAHWHRLDVEHFRMRRVGAGDLAIDRDRYFLDDQFRPALHRLARLIDLALDEQLAAIRASAMLAAAVMRILHAIRRVDGRVDPFLFGLGHHLANGARHFLDDDFFDDLVA